MLKKLAVLLILCGFCLPTSGFAGKLVIHSNQSDPAPRKAFSELVHNFKQQNPDISVEFNTYDHESSKVSIRNWLAGDAPDIVFWFPGERLNTFVKKGLIADISDLWKTHLGDSFASTRASVSFNGKQYAVPWAYYHWGVYYRKDIFQKYGLVAPKNWDELKQISKTLKNNQVVPFTIGTKYLWTAAGWFDYLNLRINGLDFHKRLTQGDVPYTNPKVKAVFLKWAELVEPGYFIRNHTVFSSEEAQAFLYHGSAAMYLIGNFIVPSIPTEIAPNMGFFPFPILDEEVPRYEDAPTEVVAIPAKAKHMDEAKRFLIYMAQPEVQSELNAKIGMLPANRYSKSSQEPFMVTGAQLLSEAAGVAQFYDQDTNPAMARIGMKGFVEFMMYPSRLERILHRLEQARKGIYRK